MNVAHTSICVLLLFVQHKFPTIDASNSQRCSQVSTLFRFLLLVLCCWWYHLLLLLLLTLLCSIRLLRLCGISQFSHIFTLAQSAETEVRSAVVEQACKHLIRLTHFVKRQRCTDILRRYALATHTHTYVCIYCRFSVDANVCEYTGEHTHTHTHADTATHASTHTCLYTSSPHESLRLLRTVFHFNELQLGLVFICFVQYFISMLQLKVFADSLVVFARKMRYEWKRGNSILNIKRKSDFASRSCF